MSKKKTTECQKRHMEREREKIVGLVLVRFWLSEGNIKAVGSHAYHPPSFSSLLFSSFYTVPDLNVKETKEKKK